LEPSTLSGLQWSFSTDSPITGYCPGNGSISASGYLS
jgi:hypothetical protein